VSDQFWGTAIFCNRTERTYLDEEIEAMKIAANIVGGAMSLYISTEERHSPGADPVPG
jgi:GAF domain-containing protein